MTDTVQVYSPSFPCVANRSLVWTLGYFGSQTTTPEPWGRGRLSVCSTVKWQKVLGKCLWAFMGLSFFIYVMGGGTKKLDDPNGTDWVPFWF